MADMPKADDIQEAMQKQIADLKREMNRINKTLAARAEDAAEEVSGWYDSASEGASRAARQVRSGAQSVSETVQQNPGTAVSTALAIGGIAGFVLGMLVGQAGGNDRRWYS